MLLRVVILLAICTPLYGHAQDAMSPPTRQEMWLSMAVHGRPPIFLKDLLGDQYKRFRLSGELGYRSADNFFAGRQIYTDLGVRYKVNDWLNVGTEYRYAARSGQANRQRIGINAGVSKSVERFNLGYRFTFQRNYLDQDRRRTLLRNRFSVEYNIRKWKLDPELSVEFFTRTDQPQGWNHIGTRYKLGTSWSPGKGHTLGPALIYDRDARVAWPTNRFIWALDYVINLRRL